LISDDPGNQSVSRHAFELMHLIIEKRLLLARLTVCDATNLEAAARRPLVEMAKHFGSVVVAIAFQVPLEVCMLRNSDRRRVVPDDTLRNQYAMFEKAKKAIDREGFDRVFILDQHSQSDAILEVSRTTTRRPRK
jgi:protein phosphatase